MLKVKKLILRLIPYFFILLFSVIFIMPLLWMVGTSLKLPIEVFSHDSGIFPADPQWGNYTAVFKRMKFGTYLRNTIITSVSAGYWAIDCCPYGCLLYHQGSLEGR
jgi:multiple sugar transport system permease protein